MTFFIKNITKTFANIYKNKSIEFGYCSFPEKKMINTEIEKAVKAKKERNEETVFDKIISRKIPADIIFEDNLCIAFNDVNPQAPIHFLVIPKKRIPGLDDTSDDEKEVLAHILLTAKTIAQKRSPNGYRLVINNGPDGCQSVYHLHLHVLGGRQMNWPPG